MMDKNFLIQIKNQDLPVINLLRDITKHLKRGHRWIFSDCFDPAIKVAEGFSILKYKKNIIGFGLVQPDNQLRFRLLCMADEPFVKHSNIVQSMNFWSEKEWQKALELRKFIDLKVTNSYRLINGEGDGMPGLVIDIYDDTAVIKHDHQVMESFWNHQAIAQKLALSPLGIKSVYYKKRNDDQVKGEEILGQLKEEVIFKENNVLFASDIRHGAKTGFFLDQRDNRKLISHFSKDKKVLNLFSYTGGFSVFAAMGGASDITSVDISKAATSAALRNFEVMGLKTQHRAIADDAFNFLEEQIKEKNKWDLVITDPPSFAPNQKSIETATAAYTKIFSQSLKLVNHHGLFAASSCSSHITTDHFFNICRESFSKLRKRGTLVYLGGQPADHPYPLAMEELRYLKFALFRID